MNQNIPGKNSMKLSHLLQQRDTLLQQTRLANLAYAYRRFSDLAERMVHGGLRGQVRLQPADPATERYWPVLTALEGNQSVIEEHFAEENVTELADLLAFITGEPGVERYFRLEEMEEQFVAPLRTYLLQSGVVLEQESPPSGELNLRE
jgi:hypothetical protein